MAFREAFRETREINSRQNPEIKLVAELKLQKERHAQQKFVAEGLRTCQALLTSPNFNNSGVKIYCTGKMLENARNLSKNTKITKNPEIILVTDTVMEKISSASTPSGILAVFQMTKTPYPDKLSSGIVLAGVSDPGNMGTLIRTCAAMGFKTIVLIDCTDVFAPKVIQASAGEIGKVNIFNYTWEQLVSAINNAKTVDKKAGNAEENHANTKTGTKINSVTGAQNNLKLIGLVATGGKNPEKINFENSLLVIGSEAHGIPQNWLGDCDELLTLPMPGETESLNAAIAGSIAMYLASVKK